MICLKVEVCVSEVVNLFFLNSLISSSSSFAGWNVHDIVGRLTVTKAEVLACLPRGWIRARDARTWSMLGECVLRLSDSMKMLVYRAACTKDILEGEVKKAGMKRKRENFIWSRQCRRHLEEGECSI